MMLLEPGVLAEKVSHVERHLTRVQQHLPATAADLQPSTASTDTVILHLLQAIQLVLDLALHCCMRLHLGSFAGYADAFHKLATAGYLDNPLAHQLSLACGLRNRIAHAYEALDLQQNHAAAQSGPHDLRAFLAVAASLQAP